MLHKTIIMSERGPILDLRKPNLSLKKFNMKELEKTTGKKPVIVLLGKRDTGMSFLVDGLFPQYTQDDDVKEIKEEVKKSESKKS
jgi:hypothetical protein